METDDEHPDGESIGARTAFFLFRSSFAFVLGLIFMFIPLANPDNGRPWCYWLGSGLAAFTFGVVLFYVGLRRPG